MILLEGPDLSGKTTVGRHLSEFTGLKIHHFGAPPKSPEEIMARIENTPKDMLLDRHPCISEQVYCTLRGKILVKPEILWNALQKLNPFIIYCNPGWEYLESKLHYLNQKEHKSKEHVEQVRQRYFDIYTRYQNIMVHCSTILDLKVIPVDFRNLSMIRLKRICREAGYET